jgi:hypothetical protein
VPFPFATVLLDRSLISELKKMTHPHFTRAFPALLTVTVLGSASSPVAAQEHTSQPAQVSAAALDDATIVAIFDNANTVDIATGKLAAERGNTNECVSSAPCSGGTTPWCVSKGVTWPRSWGSPPRRPPAITVPRTRRP